MIAKGKSICHLRASINYAQSQDKAVFLDKNIAADQPSDIAQEFKKFQDLNDRCERNSFSFVLSPTVEDGKKLSREHFIDIQRSFLNDMGLKNHQYISFLHKSTNHKHIHLFVNRIDYEGKAFQDNFIGKRSSHVARGIAKRMGLTTAMSVKRERQKSTSNKKSPEIEKVKKLADNILAKRQADSLEKFEQHFNESGKAIGIRVESYKNRSGVFQGFRFFHGEDKFKASEIDRSLSKRNIEKTLQEISQSKRQGISL